MGQISNISVATALNATGVDATVTWDTDISADGATSYGHGAPGSAVEGIVRASGTGMQHQVVIAGLDPDSDYFAKVVSSDDFGTPLGYASGDGNVAFHTVPAGGAVLPGDPPSISPSGNAAVIAWTTTKAGVGTVYYRQDGDTEDSSTSEDESTTQHRVELEDLIGASHYICHYETDLDDSDDSIISADFSFDTPTDSSSDDPPGRVALHLRPNQIHVGANATLTVRVRHKGGQPYTGVALEFSLGAGKADCALSAASGSTDAQGRCSVQVSVTGLPQGRRKARRVLVVKAAAGGKHKRRRVVLVGLA